MKKSAPVLFAIILSLAYTGYLIVFKGSGVFLESMEVLRSNATQEALISYPYLLDIGLLIAGLWVLWRFISMILSIQNKMLQTASSPYIDIYLIGMYTLTTLSMAYIFIEIGFGLGAAGMLSFCIAYGATSAVFQLYISRVGG